MRICSGLLLALVISAACFAADEPPKIDVSEQIKKLDSDDFDQRNAAFKALHEADQKSLVAELEKTVAAGGSAELIARAKELLELYGEGGEVVNGLKLRLSADREQLADGETVTFTLTVCNMTKSEMRVQVGYSTCGNLFECGEALRVSPAESDLVTAPQWTVGFCGTGSRPIHAAIGAYSTLRFKLPAVFQREYGKSKVKSPALELGTNKYTYLPLRGQKHEFRVCLKTDGERKNDALPVWTGEIRSNSVKITTKE